MRKSASILTLILVSGAVACATDAVADRPAPARAALHPQVAAMKGNTWLKLPTPAEHPIARSSSPWMPYIPEAGVALLWGCSHAGYHNDLWSHDLARNRWKELLKTEPSAARDPDVLKIKDGVLMTRQERPLSAHQWGLMDYDPDRRVLWHLGGWWQGVYNRSAHYKKIGREIRREGSPEKHQALLKKGPMLWQYSLKTNRWTRVYTEDPTGCTRHKGYIRYVPALRRLIMTPCIVVPNEDREKFKMYDPATNTWEPLRVAWEPMEEGISPYWVYSNSPIVYDAKRKALVLILRGGGTWLLDPAAKTMKQVVTKAKTPPANLDGPVGAFVYDSVNATTLAIFTDYTVYGAGTLLKQRGFPADETQVLALDVKKNEWVLQPRPADGVLPPINKRGLMVHHYYDPVHNATVVYRGPYNSPATDTWVYRYRAPGR